MIISHETHGIGTLFFWNGVHAVKLYRVRQALDTSELDRDMAHDIHPRRAFLAAKNKLKERGLILPVLENDDRIVFQLSDTALAQNGHLELQYKAQFWYHKRLEVVQADDETIAAIARALFEEASEMFPAHLLTDLVKRIFGKQNAILSVRDAGGIYFVPEACQDVLRKVKLFLQALEVEVCTAPVGMDNEAMRDSVLNKLVERSRSELDAIVKDVQTNGLTQARALGRYEKILNEVARVTTFAKSLQANAQQLLSRISTAEINLSLVANTDGSDVIAALAAGNSGLGLLGQIAAACNEGQALPPMSSERVQAALALPELDGPDIALPVTLPASPIPELSAGETIDEDVMAKALRALEGVAHE